MSVNSSFSNLLAAVRKYESRDLRLLACDDILRVDDLCAILSDIMQAAENFACDCVKECDGFTDLRGDDKRGYIMDALEDEYLAPMKSMQSAYERENEFRNSKPSLIPGW